MDLPDRGEPGALRPSAAAGPVRARGSGTGAPASRGAHPADESAESDPAAPLERAEREQIVRAALDRLGPEHRAVVVLKDFDGRRYEEISAILDIPVGTVRSRLHRARCELRDRLRGLVDEPQPVRQGASSGP